MECHLTGDPLYATGGLPKFVEVGPSDDSFAQDGYGKCDLLHMMAWFKLTMNTI